MSEETLFHDALARPAAERAAFLDAACAGQPQLRAAVEALLAAHEASASLLDQPPGKYTLEPDAGPSHLVPTTPYFPPIEPGVVIGGRYTLQEKIGEGGMGEVWVAKQTEPVKRKVALKLIKAGMDSKAVLTRFEQERQALALMDHPNIARVLDGGLTPSAQPFFVMELVNGLALTKFCDEARLTPKERLELFVPICQAVQHAHQKGIVHRDLKPPNILVTLIDGKAVPRIIDFGLAKAIGGKLTDESLSTQFGAIVGTLAYMSPEQAGYSGVDVDTRADIYSLGVILYELLTGLRPLDTNRLKHAAYMEMIRILKEEEPSRPSTRLSTDESLASVAALRQTEPRKLLALLRGELDWVVMKCLEKSRERRYETANGLAREIQRYLADEAVEARPPSATYRLGKFLKRHKGSVLAASLVLLALVCGMAGTTVGLIRAEQARAAAAQRAEGERQAKVEADTRRREAETQQQRAEKGETLAGERLVQVEAEQHKAEEEKRIAQAVRDFLQHKLLGQADTRTQADALLRAGGLAAEATENPTIRELLDRAAKELSADKIEVNFPQQPLVQAEILKTVGDTYLGVGEYERAIAFLQRAATLRKQHLGADHPDTLATQHNLALAYREAGQYAEAITLFEQVRDAFGKTPGADRQETLSTLDNLAGTYLHAGKIPEAIALYERVRDARVKAVGADHPFTLTTLHNLALAYQAAGRIPEGSVLYKQVHDTFVKTLGVDHPETLTTLHNLARAYKDADQFPEAIALFEQVRDARVKKRGPNHPETLETLANLARAYLGAGRVAEAVTLLEQVRDMQVKAIGADHPNTLDTLHDLARAYQAAGKQQEAIAFYEQVLDARMKKLGADHPNTLATQHNLARAYQAAGKPQKAIALLEQVRDAQRKTLGADHRDSLTTLASLAMAYRAVGRVPEAIALLQQVRDARIKTLGADHPHTLQTLDDLGVTYWSAKQLDKSIPLFEEVLQRRQAQLGRQHPDTQRTVANLGVNCWAAGRLEEAIPLLEEAYRSSRSSPAHRSVAYPLFEGYRKMGRLAEAIALYEQVHAAQVKELGADHSETLTTLNNLAGAYWSAKQFDKSVPLFEDLLKRREVKFGRQHPDTLLAVGNLGVNYKDAGRLKEAIPLLEEAYRASRTFPKLRFVETPLFDGYRKAGRTAEAAQLVQKQLTEARQVLPRTSPQLASALAQCSLALLQLEVYADAEPLLRESLAIRAKTEPDNWTTFNTQSMLGGALLGQQKYAGAEPLLLAGYEGMKQRQVKMPPESKERLTEAVERLVQLYEATDKQDEAAKWRKIQEEAKEAEKQPATPGEKQP